MEINNGSFEDGNTVWVVKVKEFHVQKLRGNSSKMALYQQPFIAM